MTISPDQYEKLGTFYLGREYDVAKKEAAENLVLYDSKDLVTHGVVLGMTGSGKTGLCLALLEEAAIDGVPVIAIDPKGDIGNFLLQFPNLSAGEFKPWVNEDDARRKGQSVDDFAAAQAAMWQKGLGDWGQSADRIKKLRETVDMAIYTPGSSAGLSVSILSSLDCPPPEVMDDAETLADRIDSTVSSMLGLMGVNADPVQSPEHILLSNIVSYCWKKGQNLSLENLVRHIQQPPIRKIGVVDIDTFCPEKQRNDIAMKLNNLLASPGFSAWLEGEPLNIQRMYYTADGKPRVTIFNIAHLNDNERMFFVSLLMNQLLGWMRAQQGTTSLRALFYMDEIFGYLPPTANPPSKKPMMILLKQARAFGLGILLGTQNPVDLDYKALSNIGTWFLGRLQTERDKARVLDGLEGAAGSAGAKFDRGQMENMLSALGNRIFLMNNVHEDHPVVFQVRWILSYLSGPLAKAQVKKLMDPLRKSAGAAAADASGEDSGFLPPQRESAAPRNTVKPKLPDGVEEYFMPCKEAVAADRLCFMPALIRSATVNYDDAKRKITGRASVTLVNEIDEEQQKVNWNKFYDIPRDIDLSNFGEEAEEGAEFGDLPGAAMKSQTYNAIEKDFVDWVYANHTLEISSCPLLGAFSNPGESIDAFRSRITQTAREIRDKAVEELREKFAKKIKDVEAKGDKAITKADVQKTQASAATLQTGTRLGGTVLGMLFGRKSASILGGKSGQSGVAQLLNVAAELMKSPAASSAMHALKEKKEAEAAEQAVEKAVEEKAEVEKQLDSELQKIRDQYEPSNLSFETTKLNPVKKNIQVTAVGILWVPHERLSNGLLKAVI